MKRKSRIYEYKRKNVINNRRAPIPRSTNCNIKSFKKNPLRGGKPAILKRKTGRVEGVEYTTGNSKREYKKKYVIPATWGAINTQLTCIRPEKKRRTDSLLEEMALSAATKAFAISTQQRICLGIEANNRKRGAIFCHDKKVKVWIFGSLLMNKGPQKWSGAKPPLSRRPNSSPLYRKCLRSITIPLISKDREPTLCARKYIMVTFLTDHEYEINGRNDIRFTSNINQIDLQFSLDKTPKVPSTIPVHISQSF